MTDWLVRWFFRIWAGALWLLFVWALVDMHHGNPTAINGVIGTGICATMVTGFVIWEWWFSRV